MFKLWSRACCRRAIGLCAGAILLISVSSATRSGACRSGPRSRRPACSPLHSSPRCSFAWPRAGVQAAVANADNDQDEVRQSRARPRRPGARVRREGASAGAGRLPPAAGARPGRRPPAAAARRPSCDALYGLACAVPTTQVPLPASAGRRRPLVTSHRARRGAVLAGRGLVAAAVLGVPFLAFVPGDESSRPTLAAQVRADVPAVSAPSVVSPTAKPPAAKAKPRPRQAPGSSYGEPVARGRGSLALQRRVRARRRPD